MEKLEETLAEVESLREGLRATKLNPEGHYVTETGYTEGNIPPNISYHRDGWNAEDYPQEYTCEVYVGPMPQFVPDTEKNESAKQGLQQICDSCPWYSGRYKAGATLGISEKELLSKFRSIINDLRSDLDAGEDVLRPMPEESECKHSYTEYGSPVSDPIYDFIPDTEKQVRAREALKDIYNNIPDKKIRKLAEEALGHPSSFEDILTCAIVSIGAASGLGYLIYQYLSR